MADVILIVVPSSRGFVLTWSDGPASFAPYELSGALLTAAAETARRALGAVVESSLAGDTADAAAASAALATAGYGLYQAVFKPAAEQQAQATEARKWLDKLKVQNAIESLEVVADGIDPIPWNVVYDCRPDAGSFQTDGSDRNCWQPFWGICYDLAGGRRVSPLRRFPVLDSPRVLVVCEAFVLDTLAGEQEALRSLCQANGWTIAQSRSELVSALQDGRPDILYWLGHTQTEPFGLVLGEESITPDELRQLLEGDVFAEDRDVFGGIAFLNACGTATREQSGSFLEALHPLGLSGYVATEQSTIDTFAAPLGREFLDAFVLQGVPLGRVMRQLRSRVPLGLLYGTYCPPRIHVRREPPTGKTELITVASVSSGRKLGRDAADSESIAKPLPASPYRALQSYGPRERALFAGRDADVLRFAELLGEEKSRLVILHGESGVGKTSFLRAGLLPYLEQECVGYRFARDRTEKASDSVLFVRATNDLVTQLASALNAFCSTPFSYRTPSGEDAIADLPGVLARASSGRSGPDAVREALRSDPACLGQLLSALARELPFTPVLVIDQAEEVFTLARTPADEENRNQALEMLRRAASHPTGFKVVVSLRTEYHGRFTDRLRKGTREAVGIRDYLLTDFGLDALIEVIRRPTSTTPIEYASEIPSEKYQFRFADGVVEEIARRTRAYTINRSDSVLPLVQVICSQLYERAKSRPDGTITLADLEAIGGVEGGMRAHSEGLVRRLFPSRDQLAFKRLLSNSKTQLFIRQSDGTLTTALLRAEYLARNWSGRLPFEEVLRTASAGDWRLLRVNSLRIGGDEQERPYVSLGHDALASVTAAWQDAQRRRDQVRRYAMALVVMFAVTSGLTALTVWALEQRKLAQVNEEKADEKSAEAAQKAADLEAQAKKLIAALDEANKAKNNLTNTNVMQAWTAWELGDLAQTRALLGAVPAGYRRWEWNYLMRQSEGGLFTLGDHTRHVASASFSPDGAWIVTASVDGTARVWDAHTGAEVAVLKGHTDAVWSASFSPDGTRVVTASKDRTARVWDARTGAEVVTLRGHGGGVRSASFSPDGTRVVTASDDKTARLWDVRTGVAIPLEGHTRALRSASFSGDGALVVTASDDMTARVWDAKTGAKIHTLGTDDSVISASFSPDGALVLTAGDLTARVWDAKTGAKIRTFEVDDVISASFSPDGTRVVTAAREHWSVQVWDIRTRASAILKGHTGDVRSATFSPDGARILTASSDRTVRVWDAHIGASLAVLKGHSSVVWSASFSPDGARVLTVGDDGTARVWDARTGTEGTILKGSSSAVWSASFSANGAQLVTANWDGTARVWDVRAGTEVAMLNGHTSTVNSASFSPDGTWVVTASNDETARVWDARTGAGAAVLKGHSGAVRSGSFSPDGAWIVTASVDGTARVWDARTGAEAAVLKGHSGAILSASFSPDGAWIVTASVDGTARVWDARTGAEATVLKGHADASMSASFSPDGAWIVTASKDRTARVWDARTGAEVAVLKGHTDAVGSASFSPDGTRVVTASDDKTARVWDARTGAEVAVLKGHIVSVWSASFTPDGARVMTVGGYDGTVRIWDVETGAQVAVLKGHAGRVRSSSISPDGNTVVTAGDDGTARVWDASPTPTLRKDEVIGYRRYLTRPRPDLHAEEAKRLAKASPFAAGMQRSLEHRALGVLAFEAGDLDRAHVHLIAAALLKPKPLSAQQLGRLPPDVPMPAEELDIPRMLMLKQEWVAAATAFQKVVRGDDATFDDEVRLAPLLLHAGDSAGYAAHRTALLAKYGNEKADIVVVERVLKSCMLAPAEGKEMDVMLKMAERVAAYQLPPDERWHETYNQLAVGLARLRAEKYDESEQSLKIAETDKSWNANVPAKLALVTLRQKTGKPEQAKKELADIVAYMNDKVPKLGTEQFVTGDWHDVLTCHILRKEAERVIGAK